MTPLPRRTLLTLLAAAGCLPRPAFALGRIPFGGQLRLSLPWSTRRLDPHDLNDPLAAFLGHAVFEPLFGQGHNRQLYPTLAEALPESRGSGCTVTLRPGLRSARGIRLSAEDLLWSLHRSRRFGGASLLLQFGVPKGVRGRPRTILFPSGSASEVARALSSPLTSLVSRSFTPQSPDSCGAFRAEPGDPLVLTRNMNAARGPAYLDRITCTATESIADGLRAFEVGRADLGWLGRGLHRARPDSTLHTLGSVGWLVLRTGSGAGRWSVPGAATQLVSGLDPAQLLRFGLTAMPETMNASSYAGPACELLVRNDSGYLKELGGVISALLSTAPGTVTLTPVPPAELQRRKKKNDYGLLLDIVRDPGGSLRARQLSLFGEVSRQLIRRAPPLVGETEAALARSTLTLPLAILGRLDLRLALTEEFAKLDSWNLGDVWKRGGETHDEPRPQPSKA